MVPWAPQGRDISSQSDQALAEIIRVSPLDEEIGTCLSVRSSVRRAERQRGKLLARLAPFDG